MTCTTEELLMILDELKDQYPDLNKKELKIAIEKVTDKLDLKRKLERENKINKILGSEKNI
jgi:hypothetical protein